MRAERTTIGSYPAPFLFCRRVRLSYLVGINQVKSFQRQILQLRHHPTCRLKKQARRTKQQNGVQVDGDDCPRPNDVTTWRAEIMYAQKMPILILPRREENTTEADHITELNQWCVSWAEKKRGGGGYS
jgi:hypothetical protein